MKTNLNKIKVWTALLMSSLLFSCQDVVTYDEEIIDEFTSTGAPSIEAIYAIDDQTAQITSGVLEQIIVIKGANLSNATEISFNEIPVNLRDVYATAKAAYVPIPRTIPTQITNMLKYTTKLGNTSKEFEVKIPQLAVEGLYNEFEFAGNSVQVLGNYFDLYDFGTDNVKAELEGTTIAIDSVSASKFTLLLPQNIANNSKITIKGNNFDEITLPYKTTNAIFWNFDNPDDYGFWAGTEYITAGTATDDPKPLYGSFIRIKNTFGAWSWNNLPCGGFNLDAEVAANPSDYYLKFEVNNKTSTPFYSSNNGGGYIFQLNGGNYVWNPSASVTFSTYGKWRTVRISLDEIATNGLNAGWTNLFMILQPNSEWTIDHSFANFRIEKKQ